MSALAILEPNTIQTVESLAGKFAKSALMPSHLRNKPGDVMIVMLSAVELGLPPMAALRELGVIKGKLVMSAALMRALAKKLPDCQYLVPVERTNQRCTWETKVKGADKATRVTYTIQDAQRAGLLRNPTWKAHTAAMLSARASSALVRDVYPDALMGVYTPDEASEFADDHETQTIEHLAGKDIDSVEDIEDAEVVEDIDITSAVDEVIKALAEAKDIAAMRETVSRLTALNLAPDSPERARVNKEINKRRKELAA